MWIFSISNGILSYRKKLSNRIWSMHFLVCFLFFSFFLFSQHEKEKCFSRLCSINILRNLYDLTEMFTLVYFHAICICIYIYASIKHRTNTGNIRNYITLPLVYMIRNNYRAWNVIAATERFPQVSKIREITARYGRWRERLVTSEKTRNLRTSLTNRTSRKSEDRRLSRAVWIHVTNPTLASLLRSCAFIVEKDTNGRIAWGDIRESTVGTRRRNFPVIYATKSSSTDTNYGITSMLTTIYKSARWLLLVATAVRFAIGISTLRGQHEFTAKRWNEIFAQWWQLDEYLFRLWQEVQVERQFIKASKGWVW